MTINAIIIDDEKLGISLLQKLLIQIPNVRLVGTANSLSKGVELIDKTHPQLIFLDVHMPGENGFDLFKKIHPVTFEVIVTSGTDHAITAIKNDVVDYLLKPYSLEDLQMSIRKVQHKLLLKKLANDEAGHSTDNRLSYNVIKPLDKIGVPGKNGLIFLKISEIVRCEGMINYTRIFLKSDEAITCSKTLLEFEKMLVPFNFFRIHKSHLINLDYLKEFTRGNSPYVVMTDNISLHVSRRNKELLLQRLSLSRAS